MYEVLLYCGSLFTNSWCCGIISLCCIAIAACPKVIVATRFGTRNNYNITNVTNISNPINIPWTRGERRICSCDIYDGEPQKISRTVWFRHRNRQRQINQRESQKVQLQVLHSQHDTDVLRQTQYIRLTIQYRLMLHLEIQLPNLMIHFRIMIILEDKCNTLTYICR